MLLSPIVSFAAIIDSTFSIATVNHTLATQTSLSERKPSFMQYGFRLGANIPLSKSITENLAAKKIFSGEFGIFVRFGKYVYGETGFGYLFQKNTFEVAPDTSSYIGGFDEIVELRYLQIPLRAVGDITLSENVSLQPHVGVLYQPLIQVTDNYINQHKDNLTRHLFLFTGGIGIKVYFMTFDLSFRQSFQTYFNGRSSKKQSFINLLIGFQI